MKIKKMRRTIVPFLSGFIIFGVALAADPGAPLSEQRAVSDVYHNVTVSDTTCCVWSWIPTGCSTPRSTGL
jgi:hypothetical protein